MENEKNYVYKLCSAGWIFANLESAVSGAYHDMKAYASRMYDPNTHKSVQATCSRPVVTKIKGGYKVSTITSCGTVLYRRIDVFEPEYIDKESQYDYELLKNPTTLRW